MKKILTFVLFIGVALGLSSCTKEVNQIVQPNRTVTFTIQPNKWTLNSSGTTYSTVLDLPEIDQYFQDNGAVIVYINREDDGKYEQLPMVYNGLSFSYYTNLGKIQIDAQVYDGNSPGPERPDLIYAKVVLIDSAP
jgi:hypothetical protein